ncbi:hypothetical protein ACQUW5_13770 [Legionella sp. CNM-1927-20]|uniref:hypothetical protein n=1 Tax=Legionella sp. CNM-1927-20 TaxID=3422221 RepID=UPI00403AD853
MLVRDVLDCLNDIEILFCRVPVRNIDLTSEHRKEIEKLRESISKNYNTKEEHSASKSSLFSIPIFKSRTHTEIPDSEILSKFEGLFNSLQQNIGQIGMLGDLSAKQISLTEPLTVESLNAIIEYFNTLLDKLNTEQNKEYENFKKQKTTYKEHSKLIRDILPDELARTDFQLNAWIQEFKEFESKAHALIVSGEKTYSIFKNQQDAIYSTRMQKELTDITKNLSQLNQQRAELLKNIQDRYQTIENSISKGGINSKQQETDIIHWENKHDFDVTSFSSTLDSLFAYLADLDLDKHVNNRQVFEKDLEKFVDKLFKDLLRDKTPPSFSKNLLEKLQKLLLQPKKPDNYLKQLQELKEELINNYLIQVKAIEKPVLKAKMILLTQLTAEIIKFQKTIEAAKKEHLESISNLLLEIPKARKEELSVESSPLIPPIDSERKKIEELYLKARQDLTEEYRNAIVNLEQKLIESGYSETELTELRKNQESKFAELLKVKSLDLKELKECYLKQISELQEILISQQYERMTALLKSDSEQLTSLLNLFPSDSNNGVVKNARDRKKLLETSKVEFDKLYEEYKTKRKEPTQGTENSKLEILGLILSQQQTLLEKFEEQENKIGEAQKAPKPSNQQIIVSLDHEFQTQRTNLLKVFQAAITKLEKSMSVFDDIAKSYDGDNNIPKLLKNLREELKKQIETYKEALHLITQPKMPLMNLQQLIDTNLGTIDDNLVKLKNALEEVYKETVTTISMQLTQQLNASPSIENPRNQLENNIVESRKEAQGILGELNSAFDTLYTLKTSEELIAWQKNLYNNCRQAKQCSLALQNGCEQYNKQTQETARRKALPLYKSSNEFLQELAKEYERIVIKYSGINKKIQKVKNDPAKAQSLQQSKISMCNIEIPFNEENRSIFLLDSRLKKLHDIYQSVKCINDDYLKDPQATADSSYKEKLGKKFDELRTDDMQDISVDKRSGFISWIRSIIKRFSSKKDSVNQQAANHHPFFKTSLGACATEKVLVDAGNNLVKVLNSNR